jgi:hypothetical protein
MIPGPAGQSNTSFVHRSSRNPMAILLFPLRRGVTVLRLTATKDTKSGQMAGSLSRARSFVVFAAQFTEVLLSRSKKSPKSARPATCAPVLSHAAREAAFASIFFSSRTPGCREAVPYTVSERALGRVVVLALRRALARALLRTLRRAMPRATA